MSLHFDIDLNTKNLEDGATKSKKIVGDLSKDLKTKVAAIPDPTLDNTKLKKDAKETEKIVDKTAKEVEKDIKFSPRLDNTKLKKDSKQTQSLIGNMTKSLGGLINPAMLGATAAIAVGAAFKQIVDVNIDFEKSLSGLQSILGLTTEEMKFFKDESIRMGSTTTQSASEVAEAFKLIGSQKPELLADRDALAQVTEQAIILAEASGITVPEAATALTGSLNQMSESAKESGRFINILAAGSKVGAADIPYLNAAIEKSGAVARDANLSFEQMVGALETIAPSVGEPTTAGLQFKNVLLQLQKAGKGFESGAFDLNDALAQSKAELDAIIDPSERAAAEMKLFGTENLITGKALLNNIDVMNGFTESVTGTNTALEQQAINTNNVQGSIDGFKSALEGVALSINGSGGLTSGLQKIIDLGTEVVQNFDIVAEVFSYLIEPVKEMFSSLFDLAQSLGIVTDSGDAVAKVMQFLAFTTKASLTSLRVLVKIVTYLFQGIEYLVNQFKIWIKYSETGKKATEILGKAIQVITDKFNDLINPIQEAGDNLRKIFGIAGEDVDTKGIDEIGISALASASSMKELNEQSTYFTDLFANAFESAKKLSPEMQKLVDETENLISKSKQKPNYDNVVAQPPAVSDIGTTEAFSQEAIEKLKIEAMQDGVDKRLALIDLETNARIKKYIDAGIYTKEIENQIENDKINAIQQAKNKELEATAQKLLEIENLKLNYMTNGLKKELSLIDLEYNEKLSKLDDYNLTKNERENLELEIEKQRNLAKEEADKIHKQSLLDADLEVFTQEQELKNAEINLLDITEQEKQILQAESQIAQLEAQKQFSLDMTDIQRATVDAEIALQQKKIAELENVEGKYAETYKTIGDTLGNFAKTYSTIATDETKTAEEKSKAIKQALLSEMQTVVTAAVVKYSASALGSLGFPLGLIGAPIAGAAAYGIFEVLKSQIAGFETGGVIGGTSYSGDNVIIRANSGERVLTAEDNKIWESMQQQKPNQNITNIVNQSKLQQNVNNGKEFKETNRLLQENNRLLQEARTVAIHNDKVLQFNNGVFTGKTTSL